MSLAVRAVAAALLIPAAVAAQSPPGSGADAAGDLPEILRDPDPSPLLDPQTLQARRLLGLRAEVAALILRGEPGSGFGVAALAVPLPGEAVVPEAADPAAATEPESAEAPSPPAPRVPTQLFVEIDGASFLDTNSSDLARIEVYAYALDASGGVAGHLAEAFAVDVGRLGEAIWQGGLKLYGRLELAPGQYRLRVLARNAQSGAAGLAESPLSVPEPAAAAPPPPLFRTPEGRDAWIPVRSWGAGPNAPEPRYPFVVGREAVSPSALPVLTAGRQTEALWFRPQRPGPLPPLELRASDGSRPIEIAVTALPAAGGAGPGVEIRFAVPEVAAGEYTLGAAGEGSARAPVLVVGDDSGERSLMWTDLRWRLGDGERLAAEDDESRIEARGRPGRRERRSRRGGGVRRNRRAAAEYRAALAPLLAAAADGAEETAGADDRWRAARSSLFEYQSSTLGERGAGSLANLQAGALATARTLAERDPDSLPPLIRLHEELYGTFRERRVFSLASYNRLMVETLVEIYAERGGQSGVAADALVSLGGYLQEANLPSTSSRLFRRALALHPDHIEARLALAALYERLGSPRQAAEQLAPAVAAAPDHVEARLRLALNLARSGDRQRARQLLAEVAESGGPLWLRTLALQELARQDLASGHPEAAAERIEKLGPGLNGDPGLSFLLANAYDRMKRSQEALERLATVAPTRLESPRRRYDGWPREALATVRERLDRAAAERRPQLVAGLGKAR